MTPTRKLTHNMNFGHSKIICHFRPENPQNQTQKDMNFEKNALIDPSKNAHKIRKVFIFPEFCTLRTFIQMHSLTPSNTNQLTTLGTPSNTFFKFCRPIVIHLDRSTLAQDAILNCYKRPAHNDYQLLIFSETNLILCSILAQIHSGC